MKKVDTRLIFASNANMQVLSNPERFRKDLFYRIEGNIVELPPLRERGEDILLLMSFFLTSFTNKYNINEQLDLTTLKGHLLNYAWPGNIRELRNFCKFVMINEKTITNDVIIKHLNMKINGKDAHRDMENARYLNVNNLKDSMAEYERDFLIHHLALNSWQVSKTSRAIGIERTTLYKKIKHLGIILMPESS